MIQVFLGGDFRYFYPENIGDFVHFPLEIIGQISFFMI